jgi:hypothetical protein
MNKENVIMWAKAAGTRAAKTAAQALVTLIGADAVSIITLDWAQLLGIAATMAVLSLLTSLAGLPEIKEGDQ